MVERGEHIRNSLPSLQEAFNRGERVEREGILDNGLVSKVILDIAKNLVMVESGGRDNEFKVERTSALAKVVNEANLQDSAGGYIYKDGKVIYRTSSLFAKTEYPGAIIEQMISIHQEPSIRACLQRIRDVQGS